MSEFDFEPVRGLPEALPEGERILWQGSPDWLGLACQAFHVRAVGAYFALMLVWRGVGAVEHGASPGAAALAAVSGAPVAIAGLGILLFLAWINARTTVYTITNRRVVLRIGAAITKAINIPFQIVESASVRLDRSGSGDLALALKAPDRIPLMQIWPHARPFRIAAPQPTLRAIPDAEAAAAVLTEAMAATVAVERAPAGAARPAAAAPDVGAHGAVPA